MAEETKARRQRKRRPKALTLKTLNCILTRAIIALENDLLEASDPEERRRIAHGLATLAGTYGRLYEPSELEQRIAKLEAAQEAGL